MAKALAALYSYRMCRWLRRSMAPCSASLLFSLFATLCLCGCSFIVVSAPPANHARRDYFDCSTDNLAPAVDLTVAALGGFGVARTAASDDSAGSDRALMIGLFLGVAALEVASGMYGLQTTARCREAKAALAERIERRANAAPSADERCHSDLECKGKRVCLAGVCVNAPLTTPSSAPQATPSGVTEPTPAPALPETGEAPPPPGP